MEKDKSRVKTTLPLAERTIKSVIPIPREAMEAIVASEAERLRDLDRLMVDAFGPDGTFR